jgi:hypothetical protein
MSKNTPKAADNKVFGPVKSVKSVKGPFGGGTAFKQLKPMPSFSTIKSPLNKGNMK